MIKRKFWLEQIHTHLLHKSILWLRGVRRSGKTFLCRSIEGAEYFDLELPSDRRYFSDVEYALKQLSGKLIVLDEIHRLSNPSELLKIAADYHPDTKIVATGSSTLGATSKFQDTLSGRKRELLLLPIISIDMRDFNNEELNHRLFRGGLPPFFIASEYIEKDYNEWIESFWARDIQELFRIERRYSFLRFIELLSIQSGSMFEASRFAGPCEISRTTVTNYLNVLESTAAVYVVRPFSTKKSVEIVSAPKVYSFDTGFVCFFKGLKDLREDDIGLLWEHYVLNEIMAHLQTQRIQYWRDKHHHEIDFVYFPRGGDPITIECKLSDRHFSPKNLKVFRKKYPQGRNFLVVSRIARSYKRDWDGVDVEVVDLPGLVNELVKV